MASGLGYALAVMRLADQRINQSPAAVSSYVGFRGLRRSFTNDLK
jgi:hypothetical protein